MTYNTSVEDRTYICIDLKTFYASVECAERGLDPFTTNLVVADPTRTEKTICLAISPAMKALGIRNRCRVFEIPPHIEFIMAQPRMKLYMQRSAEIYSIYLRYISAEDIHVYSIDECFIDVTPYLKLYDTDALSFAKTLMNAVYQETHITATAGIGTNLFLAKVALDITAKHEPEGIGFLTEESFREKIWHHRPITDVWNIGPGIAKRLSKYAVYDLAGVAAMKKETLFKEFGVNAEFLIDHAWGLEPCTMAQIKAYKPESNSLTSGQVLASAYTAEQAHLVLYEMVDGLVLNLIEKHLVASGISLGVGYDRASFEVQKTSGAHASRKLSQRTSSFKSIWEAFDQLYKEIIPSSAQIKRISIGFFGVLPEEFEEFSLFDNVEEKQKERSVQEAILAVKQKFGKNALLKTSSFKEKATARERNEQVGGHHG